MYYFKKLISYLDYYEYGEKKKNCGYGKIRVKDQEVTIEIHIKGLNVREGCMCDIYASGKRRSQLGRLVLDRGTGYYNACFHGMDMDGKGLCIFDMTGLHIRIDDDRYCETEWEWGTLPEQVYGRTEERMVPEETDNIFPEGAETGKKRKAPVLAEETAAERPDRESEPTDTAQSFREDKQQAAAQDKWEAIREDGRDTLPENGRGSIPQDSRGSIPQNKWEDRQETMAEDVQKDGQGYGSIYMESGDGEELRRADMQKSMPGKKEASDSMPLHKSQICDSCEKGKYKREIDEIPLQEMLHEDKWQQLCTLYPVCHPFEDGEDYISIAPKDFVILRKEYQNLVSNSFLLHSFYNYHHVILGKTGENDIYYIGAPGAYLEREKKVAVMFGFEGFAQSVRGNGSSAAGRGGKPAVETGAFGYYMRKVEI